MDEKKWDEWGEKLIKGYGTLDSNEQVYMHNAVAALFARIKRVEGKRVVFTARFSTGWSISDFGEDGWPNDAKLIEDSRVHIKGQFHQGKTPEWDSIEVVDWGNDE